MSRPPAGIVGDAELGAQHVVDDVVVRVVELELARALGAVVRAQREMQQLVRQHEHQLVVVEPRGEVRVGDQPAGREHAHGRHAIVERDAHRGGQSGEMRQRHRDHAQPLLDARERASRSARPRRRCCGGWSWRGDLLEQVEHRAVGAERAPLLDQVGQQGELVLGRQAAQEAIDRRAA